MARRAGSSSDPASADRVLAGAALDELVGAALLLDPQLRIRLATSSAEAVLGAPVPIGASAATLLCGDRPKKPFAEALIGGVAFQALIPHPGQPGGDARVRVRSVPVGGDDGAPAGWVIYLATVEGGDGAPVLFHGMWTCDARMKPSTQGWG